MLLVRRIASILFGFVPLVLIAVGVASVLWEVQAHDPSSAAGRVTGWQVGAVDVGGAVDGAQMGVQFSVNPNEGRR